VCNGRVADRILEPRITSEINSIIAEGDFYGMTTFDQSLLRLVGNGTVSVADALASASIPHDLNLMLQQAGISVLA
jgi:twitching motility protein PilT